MSLAIRRISFRDFRNYESFSLEDIGCLTVLVGPNAVGKTNVVEGIQLLTALNSFRNPTIEIMVREGASSAYLETDLDDGNRLLTLSLDMREHTKKYFLNGKTKKTQDLKGLAPAVSFTPDDLDLVKGSMSIRRNAIDALGSQLSPNHYVIRRDYEKVIRYKNRLLKEDASFDLLASIDEMVVTCGAQLMCYRIALINKMIKYLKTRYEALSSGEVLDVRYIPSWAYEGKNYEESFNTLEMDSFSLDRNVARETLSTQLAAKRVEERQRKRALIGPHADKIEFLLNGKDASMYGSQGQQRSIVLAFKLAEASVIEEVLGQKPIMLLDDVMSELDARRRTALVEFIVDDIQTFITTANLQYFEESLLERATVVNLPLKRKAV